ncbi:MAG TPA: peptide chain release factor N(5)-glutamine methyltransferase, partial [Anaerolineae bacterium]|nr:peptide chain release factor N(5)-glutamine methyltransferase [Anaerolineae bacterium]
MNVSVRQAVLWGVRVLGQHGCDSPRLDAELLLAHAMGLTRARLLAQFDRELSPAELARYRQLIERRRAHEPVAYIVGHQEFYGLDFYVDRRVLIPRPETELLVERAIKLAGEVGDRGYGLYPLTLADVGTGSGAIAVSLAVHLPQATIYALDSSAEALEVAARNVRRHGIEGRVHLLRGDLLSPLPEPVDLIVANLPYVSEAELAELPPQIRRYEPLSALDGGPDGLRHIRRLLAQAGGYLRPQGAILLEIGATQGAEMIELARRYFPMASIEVVKDYAGLDRVVIVRTR